MARAIRVLEPEVIAAPTPARTWSWRPLAHRALITGLEEAIDREGIQVVGREYSMSENGLKLFGVWRLTNGDLSGAIGFRNSNDKSMALGLVAGTHVMVCSNMAFNGEFLEFRKHTVGLNPAYLVEMLRRGVGLVMDKIRDFVKWHDNLHNYDLPPNIGKLLTFDAIEKGVIPAQAIHHMIDRYHDPKPVPRGSVNMPVYERSLFGWHGTVTEYLRDRNLVHVQEDHRALTRLINDYLTRRQAREAVRA